MSKGIALVEEKYLAKSNNLSCPEIGDIVRLSVQIKEGQKEHIRIDADPFDAHPSAKLIQHACCAKSRIS